MRTFFWKGMFKFFKKKLLNIFKFGFGKNFLFLNKKVSFFLSNPYTYFPTLLLAPRISIL